MTTSKKSISKKMSDRDVKGGRKRLQGRYLHVRTCRTAAYPHATAVAQLHHGTVDVHVEHLRQLGAVLVDSGRLLVVDPGVVENQPHIPAELYTHTHIHTHTHTHTQTQRT